MSDLDELERLARRLRDRGFPKLAPVVRSDLVLRAADALEVLIERVRQAEAERDEGWRVAAEQTRLERARAERAEAVIAEANPAVVEVTDDMIARAEREYQWSGNIRKVLVAALGGGE